MKKEEGAERQKEKGRRQNMICARARKTLRYELSGFLGRCRKQRWREFWASRSCVQGLRLAQTTVKLIAGEAKPSSSPRRGIVSARLKKLPTGSNSWWKAALFPQKSSRPYARKPTNLSPSSSRS